MKRQSAVVKGECEPKSRIKAVLLASRAAGPIQSRKAEGHRKENPKKETKSIVIGCVQVI